jgi:hypothetical protein
MRLKGEICRKESKVGIKGRRNMQRRGVADG